MPYRNLPSLVALKAFEAVARNQSFKAAGDELCVTPGAISQLVKKLESELSLTLLERKHRSIELTEAGIYLSRGLERAFLQIRESMNHIRQQDVQQVVKIAAPAAFVTKWLIPRMCHFLEQHPEVDIQFVSQPLQSDYWANEVDLGIRLTTSPQAHVMSDSLVNENMVIAASPKLLQNHAPASNIELLLDMPLISVNGRLDDYELPVWPDILNTLGFPAHHQARVMHFDNNLDQAIDAAVAGAGALLLPSVLASEELRLGRLQPVFQQHYLHTPHCRYHLQTHPEKDAYPEVITVRNWIRKAFHQCPTVSDIRQQEADAVSLTRYRDKSGG